MFTEKNENSRNSINISYLLERIYYKQTLGHIASTIGTDQVPRLGVHDHETLVSAHQHHGIEVFEAPEASVSHAIHERDEYVAAKIRY